MKAKKKPIEKVSADELGVDLKPRLETLKVTEPPKREGGVKVRVYQLYQCSPCPHSRIGGKCGSARFKNERSRGHITIFVLLGWKLGGGV